MANNLIVARRAAGDLDDAFTWYESKRPGLGDKFLAKVRSTLARIVDLPESHRLAWKNYRRALLRGFPYAIYYRFEAETVTVFGVFHTSQDPERWRKRLP